MAEARSEEEEENMMRDTREQVVRRQPNRDPPDRRKPEQRHSQGPLSSIRAVIKRTSNRSTSLSETPRDRERDRDRERERNRERRRPEITILSAEPLPSTSWFPGASAGIPPPPPPAAQIWGATIPPEIQPPPSYEEVIKEKTQEHSCLPSSSSCSSSATPTITIATQTDPGANPDPKVSQVGRPLRPPRPPPPCPPISPHVNNNSAANQSISTGTNTNNLLPDILPETVTNSSVDTQTVHTCCDTVSDLCLPLTPDTCVHTDQLTSANVTTPSKTSSNVVLERPRPRPRSKIGVPRISNEVKVQTLVKLREDGLATLAARAAVDSTDQEASQGKYLQELLQAFSSDDWGFPEQRSDGSENSQSESEGDEKEDEDMATLKARIQAFEQQQQQVADGSVEHSEQHKDFVVTKRPEPRPRPRLHPTKSAPPSIAPKPQNLSQAPKPSSKVFWEDGDVAVNSDVTPSVKTLETPSTDVEPAAETSPSSALKSNHVSVSESCRTTEKPSIAPKPQCAAETPVPAPRPSPPKVNSSSPTPNPKSPPRPAVAPRASMGSPQQDKSTAAEQTTPTLPPRPSVEVTIRSGSNETHDSTNSTAKTGSVRPVILDKPAVLTSPRRVSAPTLIPKSTGASPVPTDPYPVPTKPAYASQVIATRPSGLVPIVAPGIKPPTAAPAPALRKGPVIQNKSDATSPADSTEPPLPPRPLSVKFLPLRPPPVKSVPGRPPPPAIGLTSNQILPPSKSSSAISTSSASQSSQAGSSPQSLSKKNERVPKKGPPLPPRPKPGHPLYDSYSKQEVLIVLDDPTPAPSEHISEVVKSQTTVTPVISQSQFLLDLDFQTDHLPNLNSQSKPALEDLSPYDTQSILPVDLTDQKEQPDPPTVSGPRCVALYDYEGEEEDELTFSQGDVIALLEHISEEWGRGQIHGRIGIFPLNFTKMVEPLSQPLHPLSTEESTKSTSANTDLTESTSSPKTNEISDSEAKEWAVALFDFPGQTAEDLSFHKGALIHVIEHINVEWRRGRLQGREGLYPAAFTQPCQVQPVPGQQSLVKGVAKTHFTADGEDELSVKVGDIITQVEPVDEQ